jgi:hypothetical protein
VECLPKAILQKLRTEIVLKNAKNVAFWFSFSFSFSTFWHDKAGKRALPLAHQTRARPKALFPNGVSTVTGINSGTMKWESKINAATPRVAAFFILKCSGLLDNAYRTTEYGGKDD